MQSVVNKLFMLCHYTEYRYAYCRYAECRGAHSLYSNSNNMKWDIHREIRLITW